MSSYANCQRKSADDGFTVVEVVVSAAILFFVLTALLGLVTASQRMTVNAKQRSILTNAVAEYADRLRAIDYTVLEMSPTGQVLSNDSLSVAGYTVNFTNRLVYPDGDGSHLKTVYVTASLTIGGKTVSTTSVINVKNPTDDTTASTLIDPDAPVIEFISPTPNPDSVLVGKWVRKPVNMSAQLRVRASSPNDVITNISYMVDSVLVRSDKGSAGVNALFPFDPGASTVSPDAFPWDTEQDGVADGFQKVIAYAKDSAGNVSSVERRFIIDNDLPGAPGVPVGSALTGYSGQLQFSAAQDPVVPSGVQPRTFASRYIYALYKQPLSGGAYSLVSSDTVDSATGGYAAAIQAGGTITAAVPTVPFSRYKAQVWAGSPVDVNWTDGPMTAVPFVSRPECVSTVAEKSTCQSNYVKAGSDVYTDYVTVLYVSKAAFPVSATNSYALQYKEEAAGAVWTAVTLPTNWAVTEVGNYYKITFTLKDAAIARTLWFRVGITVTPTDTGTALPMLFTNAIGTTPLDTSKLVTVKSALVQLNPDTSWAK